MTDFCCTRSTLFSIILLVMWKVHDCHCLQVLNDFEIVCPGQGIDSRIMVRIRRNIFVQVECQNTHPSEFKLLPKINIGNNPMLKIRQCPLPLLQPIRAIIQRLGINQVNTLLFESRELGGIVRFRALKHLPSGFLSNLPNLREIRLSCDLGTISADVLANSKAISQIELIHLDLTRNKLTSLPEDIFQNTRNLMVLRLSHNQLTNVTGDTFNSLQNLEILFMELLCLFKYKRELLPNLTSPHNNISQIHVQNLPKNLKTLDLFYNNLKENPLIAMSMLTAVVGLILGILAAYKYQMEIKVWLYAHNMCLRFVTEEELDKDKIYDAFISYSDQDRDFIAKFLVPELENGPTPFNLCLHYRDKIVGEFIPKQIVRSVDHSRRTIVVVSPNFMESKSEQARKELLYAHTAALNEGRARVIIILKDMGNVNNLDEELRAYLKTDTYVEWGDPLFWDKLRSAMPHPSNKISASARIKTSVRSV